MQNADKSINSEGIENKVKEILSDKLNFPIEKISSNSFLVNDLGMDSFGLVEISFEIKDKFGLNISYDDVANIRTVRDIVQHIISHATTNSEKQINYE